MNMVATLGTVVTKLNLAWSALTPAWARRQRRAAVLFSSDGQAARTKPLRWRPVHEGLPCMGLPMSSGKFWFALTSSFQARRRRQRSAEGATCVSSSARSLPPTRISISSLSSHWVCPYLEKPVARNASSV